MHFFSKLSKYQFSAISSAIKLKIFIGETSSDLDPLYQWSLTGFAKFLGSKKPKDFVKCSVFCFSSLKYLEFLKKTQNHPSRLGPSTYSKNFSSNEWNRWICGRGEFLTSGSLQVNEDEVRQICVYDNFCSTIRGRSRFLERGGPLTFEMFHNHGVNTCCA